MAGGKMNGSGLLGGATGSSALSNYTMRQDFAPASAAQTAFTVTLYTLNATNAKVYVDGIFQTTDRYSISGQTVTFVTGMGGGEIITATN